MKIINRYNIVYFPSGIIQLNFTSVDKWIGYRAMNDFMYRFNNGDSEENIQIIEISTIKFIPGTFYIRTDSQNKDEISFYFIPFSLVDNETSIEEVEL